MKAIVKTDASNVLTYSKYLTYKEKNHFSSGATFLLHQMKIYKVLKAMLYLILATGPPYLLPLTNLIDLKITERKNHLICLGFR